MGWDRDVGVAFARAWAREPRSLTGWEVTAATGIRGLRLLGETGAFSTFTFTEANDAAFAVLSANVEGRAGALAVHTDARDPPAPGSFDYVDLDPYGSPLPFLAGALRATRTGGILAVTATDLSVLAGAQPAATERRYGAVPVRGRLGPEGGLRILLMSLAVEARRTDRAVRPLLAYVRGHYVRAYVGVCPPTEGPDPIGSIETDRWTGPPLGAGSHHGPFWLGSLGDRGLAARMVPPPGASAPAEVARFLDRYREELTVPQPFYYEPNSLAHRLGLVRPPAVEPLRRALVDAGFRAVRTHVRPEGLRTDAPRSEVDRVARSIGGADQSQNARVRA
jgi:tRNA (guanine26-N2/guanine27-N2)-dimethyltransferase